MIPITMSNASRLRGFNRMVLLIKLVILSHPFHSVVLAPGKSRAEFKMKVSSEATWIKAANSGLNMPNAASPTPMLSTAKVPPKFCMMMRRQRREILISVHQAEQIIANQHDVGALACDFGPDPIAMPTVACMSAGASLIPSPTIATFFPIGDELLDYCVLLIRQNSA